MTWVFGALSVVAFSLYIERGRRLDRLRDELHEVHERIGAAGVGAGREWIENVPGKPRAGGRVESDLVDRVMELETRIRALEQAGISRRTGGWSTVGESAGEGAEGHVNSKGKVWGAEQAVGAPDSEDGGERGLAWAPSAPDGREEWIELEYSSVVDVAEVRVHESKYPGAISKVGLFQSGESEFTIWEGEAPLPLVRPTRGISKFLGGGRPANRVRVWLDTGRVDGWPEIDAVEVVALDGSRQWARRASASSSLGDTLGEEPQGSGP